jgi:hypothetical protein
MVTTCCAGCHFSRLATCMHATSLHACHISEPRVPLHAGAPMERAAALVRSIRLERLVV